MTLQLQLNAGFIETHFHAHLAAKSCIDGAQHKRAVTKSDNAQNNKCVLKKICAVVTEK